MAKNSRHIDVPLEPGVAERLQAYLDDKREELLPRALWLSGGEYVSIKGLEKAISESRSPVADVQDVISQALSENRRFEYASYLMILTLFVFGLFLLGRGALSADTTRIGFLSAGSIVELLILAPLKFAITSRRHNIAIRMLGVVLNRVENPDDLAPILKNTFLTIVLGESSAQTRRRR
jgi:hypothetical protein